MSYTITKEESGKVLVESTTLPPKYLPCEALTRQTPKGVEVLNSDYQIIAELIPEEITEVDDGTTQTNPTTPTELFNALKTVFDCGGTSSTPTETTSSNGSQDVSAAGTEPGSAVTPVNILADTPTVILNNGLGLSSILLLPDGVSSLWNATTSQFDFSSLPVGSFVVLSMAATITTLLNKTNVMFSLDFAIGGAVPFTKVIGRADFKGSTVFTDQTFTAMFYIRDDNMRLNPAQIKIVADNPVTLLNQGFSLGICKR